MKKSLILGIETSCDETAAAVVQNGSIVLSNIISSQIDTHRIYGGVVPEIASRKHIENINYVVEESLQGISMREIDAIAVTYGPGLVGALLVGLNFAKGLSFTLKKPLIGVNHMEGHICANYIENDSLRPPFICLVVSGGHTHLIKVKDYGIYEILGKTRDDAAGEAYDKVARTLGLSYPGGPAIDALAQKGNPKAILLPRAEINGSPYDFSFSGLKSAVLNFLQKAKIKGETFLNEDIAASFQQAVIDVLVNKTIKAANFHSCKTIALAGGVASNSGLRKAMRTTCDQNGLELYIPKPVYCTDNAAMIAVCGYYYLQKGKISSLYLNARPELHWNL